MMKTAFQGFLGEGSVRLRGYQEEVAQAVLRAVPGYGEPGEAPPPAGPRRLAVMLPRQSGKNELQALLTAFLLCALQDQGGELVQISPTWRPQGLNAMRRLERVLRDNALTAGHWKMEHGFSYRIGLARVTFLSGEPSASIVGHTANVLLMVDEAQDILVTHFDKEIAPMAASTNAPMVFWGTAWSRHTLLAREIEAALAAQAQDGVRRAFICTANEVGREVPAYAEFVANQVARLGRSNPLIRSQYFSEAVDEGLGLLSPEQRGLLEGEHAPALEARPGGIYAALIDVGGGSFGPAATVRSVGTAEMEGGSGHDPTAVTIVEVGVATDETVFRRPIYRVVRRIQWDGLSQPRLFAAILSLVQEWHLQKIVIDATGLGAGLAGFLSEELGSGMVRPFIFSAKSKSELAYQFLNLIEGGRLKDYRIPAGGAAGLEGAFLDEQAALKAECDLQIQSCRVELVDGQGRTARWGVPDGLRSPVNGALIHDDLLVSLAMTALLDEERWSAGVSVILPPVDPLERLEDAW